MLSSLATKQKVGSHLAWLSYSFPPLRVWMCVCWLNTATHCSPPPSFPPSFDCPPVHPPPYPSLSPPPLTTLTSSLHPPCIHAFTLWAESINISWKKKQKNKQKEPGKRGHVRGKKQRSRTQTDSCWHEAINHIYIPRFILQFHFQMLSLTHLQTHCGPETLWKLLKEEFNIFSNTLIFFPSDMFR